MISLHTQSFGYPKVLKWDCGTTNYCQLREFKVRIILYLPVLFRSSNYKQLYDT